MATIKKDSTQSIKAYAPSLGVPSTALVRVQTPSTSLPPAGSEDSATIDSVSATTNAAAAQGATSLSFASDPGLTVGNRYLLTDTDGKKYTFEAVATGATSYIRPPLPASVNSGAAVSGIAITHALTADETSTVGNGLALWTCTVNGVAESWSTSFRIDDETTPRIVSGADIEQLYASIPRLKNATQDSPEDIIDSVWRLKMRPMLLEKRIRPERINSPQELESAMVAAIVCHLTEMAFPGDIERLDDARKQMERALTRCLNSKEFWYDETGDEEAQDQSSHPKRWNVERIRR